MNVFLALMAFTDKSGRNGFLGDGVKRAWLFMPHANGAAMVASQNGDRQTAQRV